MLITPHALVGAAITKRTNSLLWGLPLAYISHFILDTIPNWDLGLTCIKNVGVVIIDGIIALLLIRFLSNTIKDGQREKVLLWMGSLFGILPDILSQVSNVFGLQRCIPFEGIHQGIQKSAHINWSLPVQILLSVLIVGWIYYIIR